MTEDELDEAVTKFRAAVAANDEAAGMAAIIPLVVGTLKALNGIAVSLERIANAQREIANNTY